jgi:hypothetical protein
MATKTAKQPGRDILTTTAVQLLGVATFTMLAGISDDMGSVMVVLMWGFALGWLLLHTTELGTMVKALLWAHNSGRS